MALECPVYVDSRGEFSAELDPRIDESAHRMDSVHRHKGFVELKMYRGKWRVYSRQLEVIREFLKAAAEDTMQCEVIRERVIAYRIETVASFYITSDGGFHPNGCHPEGGVMSGGWWKQRRKGRNYGSDHQPGYRIGLGAAVLDRLTYRRKSGDTVVYEYVRYDEDEQVEVRARDLNTFSSGVNLDDGDVDFMPYTEEAAAFFADMIRRMCHMVKAVDDFFADKPRLERLIAEGKPLLLT